MLEASLSSFIDIKTGKIPNKWNLSLFLLNSAISSLESQYFTIIVRILAVVPLALVFYKIGFGGGDCKLIIAISPLLSPFDLGIILFISCILALTRGKGQFHSYYFIFSFYIVLFPRLIKKLKAI